MSNLIHERPGVYSVYDTSAVVSGGNAVKKIGVAARAASGELNSPVTVTGFAAGVSVFGEGGMSDLLRLLFANGAGVVYAVWVGDEGTLEDYQSAFHALEMIDAQIVVCDSSDPAVHQALRSMVVDASAARKERVAVVGGSGDSVQQLTERASALNCERMVLVGPDVLDASGKNVSGVFAAAAVAGLIAGQKDPALPLNGAEIKGLSGVAADYSDNDVDLLVRGGVTPLECSGGVVSPVRGITTRSVSGGVPDSAWRELTSILIVDDIIPSVRNALRTKFTRSKNTPRGRAAIRSQVIVELEKKLAAEIIDGYDQVSVSPSPDDPAVCLVEFAFSVAHGLNQIYLSVHITV